MKIDIQWRAFIVHVWELLLGRLCVGRSLERRECQKKRGGRDLNGFLQMRHKYVTGMKVVRFSVHCLLPLAFGSEITSNRK